MPGLLTEAQGLPSIREVAILSTCNRTEVYCVVLGGGRIGAATMVSFLSRQGGMSPEASKDYLYQLSGREVVCHLFRVSASLDSMVVGEPQILSQVKKAYDLALETGATGPVLGRLFQRAVEVGKRVRTETGIGEGGVSIGSAAIELATKVLGALAGRRLLVIGTGEMAQDTLSQLVSRLTSRGIDQVIVLSASQGRADRLASQYLGRGRSLEDLDRSLQEVDVAVAATACPRPFLGPDRLRKVMAARQGRPLVVIDIALPRNVAPEAGRLEGLFLYDLDDLRQVAEINRHHRGREIPKAEALVSEEVDEYWRWYEALDSRELIRTLRLRAESVRSEEVERTLRRFPDLDPAVREAVDRLTIALVNKLLHHSTEGLRALAEDGSPEALDLARRLLALDEEDRPPKP